MDRVPDKGECPYCGVFVQFTGMGNVGIRQEGPIQVSAYLCPSCSEGVVVLVRGSEWTRYPATQPKDIPGVPEDVWPPFGRLR